MISRTATVSRPDFERETGWELKPQGACWGERCIPLHGMPTDEVDLEAISTELQMPLVHDQEVGLWGLGPRAGGKALESVHVPDLQLTDWRGEPFSLGSLRGQKVLLLAWASW